MRLPAVKETEFSKYIIHEIHRPYGTFYLFEKFIVSEVFEGVVFGALEALDLFTLLMEFYDGIKRPKSFVFLSNRLNSYSIKPVDWLDFEFMNPYLLGYGIIDISPLAQEKVALEKKFLPFNAKLFRDLETAIGWTVELQGRHRLN